MDNINLARLQLRMKKLEAKIERLSTLISVDRCVEFECSEHIFNLAIERLISRVMHDDIDQEPDFVPIEFIRQYIRSYA